MENLIDNDLEKISSDESGNKSDNESMVMIKIMMNITNNFLKL